MFVGGVKGETPDNVIQVSRYKLFHENTGWQFHNSVFFERDEAK